MRRRGSTILFAFLLSLAEQACISRNGFSTRFTACVGKPPLQYLSESRMRKALQLLRETDLGVKAIAMRVGYSNESAFSNAFRRIVGMSPGTRTVRLADGARVLMIF
jgi:AraC-like DNA-binding protein